MTSEPPGLLDDERWDDEPEELLAGGCRSRAARWLLAVIALLVVAALILSQFPLGERRSRPDKVSGVVSTVSADGSSFCVILDATGRTLCSDVVRAKTSEPLVVGQHVTGVLILAIGDSSPVPIFVVSDPAP